MDGVTSIGNEAFKYCTALESAYISEHVERIGSDSFFSCTSLSDVQIQDGVISIGDGAFSYCDSLKSIYMPNSVMSLGEGVFTGCKALAEVRLPGYISSISNNLFSECSSLTSLVIYDAITSIGDYAFAYSEGNKVLTLTDETTDPIYKDFGNFYVIPNEETGEYEKIFCLVDGFTFRVIGTGEGIMDVSRYETVENGVINTYSAETIPVSKSEAFTVNDTAIVSDKGSYSLSIACNHSFERTTVIEATVTTDGYSAEICSHCGQTKPGSGQIIPATGSSGDGGDTGGGTGGGSGGSGGSSGGGASAEETDHHWDKGTVKTKAGFDSDGEIEFKCIDEGCSETKSETISAVNARFDVSALTYNGKAQNPSLIVPGLKMGSDYSVVWSSGSKNVGKYYAKITLGGDKYSGTKKLSYTIIPKSTSIKVIKPAKKALNVKWSKQSAKMGSSRIAGYQVQVSTNDTFTEGKKTVTVKGYKKTSKKIANLKSKKRYYVRIRTYMKNAGKTYYSSWSKGETAKTQ